MSDPVCNLTYLGRESAVLTGWTWRVCSALAHLREAWCVADAQNRPAAEASIAALLGALLVRASNALECAERVLRHGLDEELGEQLWSVTHSQAQVLSFALRHGGAR